MTPTETGAVVLEQGRENIADFHLHYHATAFLLAVGADRMMRPTPEHRIALSVINTPMGTPRRWFVTDDNPIDRNCVAIFNERADADLFVAFMKP